MIESYTVRPEQAVDVFVQEQLNCIVDNVVELMGKDLQSIVLAGGFGRGEGSIRIDENGNYKVVNDYDIEVVYHEMWGAFLSKVLMHLCYSSKLTNLASQLADKLDIKQIDLVLKGNSDHSLKITPGLADYDLKYGNRLLFGNVNPVDLMPEYKADQIPRFEGTWLLRNRGIGLLLAFFYIKNGDLLSDKREYFGIEVNKAILAMGDALFITTGNYHVSYAKRAEMLNDILPDDFRYIDDLKDLYPRAVAYKLQPDAQMFADRDPVELWKYIAGIYISFALYYESERTGEKFDTIEDYITWISGQPTPGLFKSARLAFDRLRGAIHKDSLPLARLKVDRQRSIGFTLALLAGQIEESNNLTCIQQLSEMMGKSKSGHVLLHDWHQITRAFLLLVHPKGELGRMLNEVR